MSDKCRKLSVWIRASTIQRIRLAASKTREASVSRIIEALILRGVPEQERDTGADVTLRRGRVKSTR